MIPRSSRPFQSLRAGSARTSSRSALSALTFGVPLLLLMQALTSCGDDEDGAACPANQVRACIVTGQTCEASQTCAGDGSGYSVCACNDGSGSGGSAGGGAGGSANAGAAGAAGAGPSGDQPLFDPTLFAIGAACETDADCPVGPGGEAPLTCITQTSTAFGEGGPQGGYCSLPCTDSAECGAIDGPSACNTEIGYCFRLCQPGESQAKCSSPYQACLPADPEQGIGVCLPVCTSDLSCGEGLFCNLTDQNGVLCTPEQRTGGEIGAPCTDATAATDCKSGLCVSFGGANPGSFCSDFCTFGNFQEGCGFSPESGAPRETLCGLTADPAGDIGDLGLCVELCDEAADCGQADWECEIFPDEELQTAFTRLGQCVPPGTSTPVPDAGVVGDAGG
jgi:hypothetical protein